MPALKLERKRYTYADYLEWETEERYELLEGEPVIMPSPPLSHQRVLRELTRQIGAYLDGRKCEVIPAPFDVRLFEGKEPKDVDTVVQPDIVVVCDPEKLDERGCRGAPDLILEILSPSTRRYDRLVKLRLYEKAGVREYWTVDPANGMVQVFLRKDGGLRLHEDYIRDEVAKVNILEGCEIDLARVFTEQGRNYG